MLVLGLDFETTGIDPKVCRPTEIGAVLWDTELKMPLVVYSRLIYAEDYPEIEPGAIKSNGITKDMLVEYGIPFKKAMQELSAMIAGKATYVVAHNGKAFDKVVMIEECNRVGLVPPNLPWIDTLYDLHFGETIDSKKLKHLALEHGFINPFSHRAVFDVLTMLRVMSHYDLELVINRSKAKEIVVRAMVPHPKQDNGKGKDFAKSLGFRWQEIGGNKFDNCWVKLIKDTELSSEKEKAAPYTLVVVKELV